MWSILNEIDIPLLMQQLQIGLSSIVIPYLPDLFVPAMIGSWLDNYGEEAGYFRMFIFFGICCVIAVVLSLTLAKKVKSLNAAKQAETVKEAEE